MFGIWLGSANRKRLAISQQSFRDILVLNWGLFYTLIYIAPRHTVHVRVLGGNSIVCSWRILQGIVVCLLKNIRSKLYSLSLEEYWKEIVVCPLRIKNIARKLLRIFLEKYSWCGVLKNIERKFVPLGILGGNCSLSLEENWEEIVVF